MLFPSQYFLAMIFISFYVLFVVRTFRDCELIWCTTYISDCFAARKFRLNEILAMFHQANALSILNYDNSIFRSTYSEDFALTAC